MSQLVTQDFKNFVYLLCVYPLTPGMQRLSNATHNAVFSHVGNCLEALALELGCIFTEFLEVPMPRPTAREPDSAGLGCSLSNGI